MPHLKSNDGLVSTAPNTKPDPSDATGGSIVATLPLAADFTGSVLMDNQGWASSEFEKLPGHHISQEYINVKMQWNPIIPRVKVFMTLLLKMRDSYLVSYVALIALLYIL
uniref:Uncharacterized protein n=1 Tax=Nelumbo nucifera TaxID=4432 RepID=A0A822YN82_NELNU|nr:TPA_asm: hypothetical protein HUJ06_012394 [Nelumbo nucifera]